MKSEWKANKRISGFKETGERLNMEAGNQVKRGEDAGLYRIFGYLFVAVATWLFFDSTKMTTYGIGYLTGMFPRGGFWDTTSMAVIFLPLLVGVVWLIYLFLAGGENKWAKILSWSGLAGIAIEALSRVRFHIVMKTSSFLILLGVFACGLAMLLRARILSSKKAEASTQEEAKQ